jgi:hypothetical protein
VHQRLGGVEDGVGLVGRDRVGAPERDEPHGAGI